MAENKKAIIIYADWMEKFEALSDDEAGRLIKHFFKYVNDLNPEYPDRITEIAFIDIKNTLKRDLDKWEKRAENSRLNGQKGGRPTNPLKPKETHRVISEPKKPVSVSVNGIVIGNVSDNKDELLKVRLSEIFERITKERNWLELTARNLKINLPTADESCNKVGHELKAFLEHLGSTGDYNKSDTDIKKHFVNYYKKRNP